MNESQESENRKKIYAFISQNPGIHLSKIAEMLHMKISEVEHYLDYFKEKGMLIVTKDAGYKQYSVVNGHTNPRDKWTQKTRREIYDQVAKNPEIHLSKIAKKIGISIPLSDYHLLYMEKKGDIISIKDERGYFKRYYVRGSGIGSEEKKILTVLQKKIPLKIVIFLIKYPNLRHKHMLKYLNISSSTLSYHLTRLAQLGIVEVRPHGRDKGYYLKDKENLIRILKKYELQIELHMAVEGFKDLWEDFDYGSLLK